MARSAWNLSEEMFILKWCKYKIIYIFFSFEKLYRGANGFFLNIYPGTGLGLYKSQ
jgi:hypothetical protein